MFSFLLLRWFQIASKLHWNVHNSVNFNTILTIYESNLFLFVVDKYYHFMVFPKHLNFLLRDGI
jgi:hypothetical protein